MGSELGERDIRLMRDDAKVSFPEFPVHVLVIIQIMPEGQILQMFLR